MVLLRAFLITVLPLFVISCNSKKEQVITADVTINDLSISEGTSPVVDVMLSQKLSDVAIISYQTEDGSATAGQDYKSASGQLTFDPGTLRQSITLEIFTDELVEGDETFSINLTAETNNITIIKSAATITIKDQNGSGSDGTLQIPSTGYTTPATYDGWTLLWGDEFDADQINEDDWTFEIGTGYNGWGNNELQYYKKENASIVDGNLVITAKKETFGGRAYTSTRMITKGKQEFEYGRVDIRAALPYGQGIWPALWMLGSNIDQVNWPACGEIDIMESISDGKVYGTAHWSNNGDHAQYGGNTPVSQGEFHVFSIVWNSQSITWYLDDKQYQVIDITPSGLSEFRQKFFFIFNVAVGGNWPGNPDTSTTFPQYMIVDYVRLFQKN